MRAIGIDLGTTNSAAAAAIADGPARILPTSTGESLTPSVVSYLVRRRAQAGEIVAGRLAAYNAAKNPEDTIYSIKRLMGHVYGDARVEQVKQRVSYELAPAPTDPEADQTVRVLIHGQPHTPTEVTARIVAKVKEDAEAALGERVTHAVITVPGYFDERQRWATAEAGRLAGLEVLEIVDEATAAAIASGIGRECERAQLLVYDLGGASFDVSIIQVMGGQYSVLESTGDHCLGGDDFDRTIVARILDSVREKYGHDGSGDSVFLAKAWIEAEQVKKALTNSEAAEIILSHRIPGSGEQIHLEMEVTREQFEEDIEELVSRSIHIVQGALEERNLTPDALSKVLLVGGSTCVPAVRRAVTELFGEDKVDRRINPMECVALGAAMLAAQYDLREQADRPSETLRRAVDENVQFTVYRPRAVRPERWYPLLAFAHLTTPREGEAGAVDPLAEVERQARDVLGDATPLYGAVRQDSTRAVPREEELLFVPDAPGVEFNPPRRSFRWCEDVHREEFRFRASTELEGSVARGRLSVFLGDLLIANVTIAIPVRNDASEEADALEASGGRRQRRPSGGSRCPGLRRG